MRKGAGRKPITTPEAWIEAARRCLIDDGISGVNVYRIAARLKVSRGGFYNYFADRDDLLRRLLEHWESDCVFLPDLAVPTDPVDARGWLERMAVRLIEGDGYDGQLDLAVREWARADRRAEWAIERADRDRLARLQRFFAILGYEGERAAIRARILYYQQIGYHAIGVRHAPAERRRTLDVYLDILCGDAGLPSMPIIESSRAA